SGSCVRPVLLMLLFITFVYSAAMREAFNRNSPEPAVLTVSDPLNAVGFSDPIAVCTTSSPMDNPAESDSVEHPDIVDGKSKEDSNSADQTEDYDHQSSKKRNKLPVTETLGLDNDSAESKSEERTHVDKTVKTENQPSKTR
ncbi:uncharacterized protein DAT39_002532, partial [Clarias magur]